MSNFSNDDLPEPSKIEMFGNYSAKALGHTHNGLFKKDDEKEFSHMSELTIHYELEITKSKKTNINSIIFFKNDNVQS